MNTHVLHTDVPGDTRRQDRATIPAWDSRWTGLYRAGSAAAFLSAVLIPLQIAVFIAWPPPLSESASVWFTLFEQSPLRGLLSLDLLLMIDYVLLIPIMLAMYVALRRTNESLMLLGAGLFMVSVAIYFASNTAFEMLALSGRYATASSEAQRLSYLAAGEAMLAIYQGTAFNASYIIGSIAGALIGVVMLQGRTFTRASAWMMIVGNVVGLGLYLPVVGVAISAFSGVILWAWIFMMALQLNRLAHGRPPVAYGRDASR